MSRMLSLSKFNGKCAAGGGRAARKVPILLGRSHFSRKFTLRPWCARTASWCSLAFSAAALVILRSAVLCAGAFCLTRTFVGAPATQSRPSVALQARGGGEYDISGSGVGKWWFQVLFVSLRSLRTRRIWPPTMRKDH